MISRRSLAIALLTLFGSSVPAQSPPVSRDSSRDKAAIIALNKMWEARFNARDASGLAHLFTKDCVRMPDGAPTTIGGRALAKAYATEFTPLWKASARAVITTSEVVVGGDYAFARGSDKLTMTKDGKVTSETGKWMGVYRRERDGSWKYYWSTYNSNRPH